MNTTAICDRMESSPRGAVNTVEGSNPEIAYTIGGLRMSVPKRSPRWSTTTVEARCFPWEGRPTEFQHQARAVMEDRLTGQQQPAWIYIVPMCETKLCLQEEHLRMMRLRKIEYPPGVCIYCGLTGLTKDHLLPVTMTGLAVRKFVATVPACHECNSAIGDRVGPSIVQRREEAHRHIRKKNRKLLEASTRWSPAALAELGPNLRRSIEASLARRELVQMRLDWPLDSDYDFRAMQKSGFDELTMLELM